MTGTLNIWLSKHQWVTIWSSRVTAGLQMKKRLSFEMEEVRAIRNLISCRTSRILLPLLPLSPYISQSSLSQGDPLPVPCCILGNGLSLLTRTAFWAVCCTGHWQLSWIFWEAHARKSPYAGLLHWSWIWRLTLMPNFCLLHISVAGSPFDLIRVSVLSLFHTKPLSGPWLIACKLSCFHESEIKSQSRLLRRCKDWLETAASLFTPSLCMLSSPGEGRVRWIWLLQVVVTNWGKCYSTSVLCSEWAVGPETCVSTVSVYLLAVIRLGADICHWCFLVLCAS